MMNLSLYWAFLVFNKQVQLLGMWRLFGAQHASSRLRVHVFAGCVEPLGLDLLSLTATAGAAGARVRALAAAQPGV